MNVTVKCQAVIYFKFFSKRYGDKDLKLSYLIASYCVQNPTEYIDMIETSDTQTQTAGQKPCGRPGKTATATKTLKGKLYLFAKES